MGSPPVFAYPAASSSRRLNSLSPRASSVRGANAASSRPPWGHRPASGGGEARRPRAAAGGPRTGRGGRKARDQRGGGDVVVARDQPVRRMVDETGRRAADGK